MSIEALHQHKLIWLELSVQQKLELLKQLQSNIKLIKSEWIAADIKSRGRLANDLDAAMSIIAGPAMVLRLVRAYIETFTHLTNNKNPQNNLQCKQNRVTVFPLTWYDKIAFLGQRAEVDLTSYPTRTEHKHAGELALVLAAGNYAALTFADLMHKLFNDAAVVIVKTHPVTEYFGGILKKIFHEFIQQGFVDIVDGDVRMGKELSEHPLVDSVHLTGADKTFETIVFGSGEIGKQNKLNNKPITTKKVTGELGNISPMIIIPGPWSENEIDYQAENILASHVYNSGFSCNATKIIIQQKSWNCREKLNTAIEKYLRTIPQDKAYYPGTHERIERALQVYPNTELFGEFTADLVPWCFAKNLKSIDSNQLAFQEEIFGSFFAETTIDTNDTVDYIEKAVDFCNQHLWGTLNVSLLVHPKLYQDQKVKVAIETAIQDLKYGTVAINLWPAFSYYIGVAPWGGYSGATLNNIQSGNCFVHNPFMLRGIKKSIYFAPFKIWPKSLFPTNPKTPRIAKSLLEYETNPNFFNLLKIIYYSF